jgi:hypothetical protein
MPNGFGFPAVDSTLPIRAEQSECVSANFKER